MKETYIISIDQSTQGTKALLFDRTGAMLGRADLSHQQIINEKGWVSHDPEEIYCNTVAVVRKLLKEYPVDAASIAGIGISNQRETSLAWNRKTGKPYGNAIVWQCSRAADICERLEDQGYGAMVRKKTGIPLSPYFPASKYRWILEQISGTDEAMAAGELCFGTVDSWLVYRLTGGKYHKTDYSNASRTQLFNVSDLDWDDEVCGVFGIDRGALPQICDSNGDFGSTDLEGVLPETVPIRAVLGDSHGALFGQGCLERGQIKTTYGTGSSIMMNIGEEPILSEHGIVTSLAWGMDGHVNYVLEGNLNYTGAVISWLKDDLQLISHAGETEGLALEAVQEDDLYLVPAFTGLGAPYWNSKAQAALTGMTRTTGKNEVVRAGLECIAYQISDIIEAMKLDSGITPAGLRVDGGPTRNKYLMQFQSDILNIPVLITQMEELSGIGAAWMAGMKLGLWGDEVFDNLKRMQFQPKMEEACQSRKKAGWKKAVNMIL